MSEPTPTPAQAPVVPVTGVFALLTPKAGVTREQIMPLMPAEARATARLYLAGKIRQWHSRADGRGAVFLLDVKNVEEAHAMMETLPLAQAHLVDHECIAVGPLMPLGLLMRD